MFVFGQYVEQDLEQAFKYLKEAAERGDLEAQRNMGIMLINGEGVDKNTQLGYQWIEKAANAGDKASRKILANRDE